MRCLLFLLIFPVIFAKVPTAALFPTKVEAQNVVVKDLTTKILNGPKNGAAYVNIYNGNQFPVTLYKVKVTPEVFDRVELHDHVERTAVAGHKYMQMIEIPEMEIAPGQTLFLAPGSKHLMLMDIKPTYCGEKTLTFKFSFRKNSRETFDISVEIPVVKDSPRCGE
jgi:copper(I)-binding protein